MSYNRTEEKKLGKGGTIGANGKSYPRELVRAAVDNFNNFPTYMAVPVTEPHPPEGGSFESVQNYVADHPEWVAGKLATARYEDMGDYDDIYVSFDLTDEAFEAWQAGKYLSASFGIDKNMDSFVDLDGKKGIFDFIFWSHYALLGVTQPAFPWLDEVVASKGCGKCQRHYESEAFPLTLQGGKEMEQMVTPVATPATVTPVATPAPAAEGQNITMLKKLWEELKALFAKFMGGGDVAVACNTEEEKTMASDEVAPAVASVTPAPAVAAAQPPPVPTTADAAVAAVPTEPAVTEKPKEPTIADILAKLDEFLTKVAPLLLKLEESGVTDPKPILDEGIKAIIGESTAEAAVASKPARAGYSCTAAGVVASKPDYESPEFWRKADPLKSDEDAKAIAAYQASKGGKGDFTAAELEQIRRLELRSREKKVS